MGILNWPLTREQMLAHADDRMSGIAAAEDGSAF
jgi:hypothetical protein